MAIKFNRSQTFATNGTVTAAGLHNLIDGTDIYQALITDQTTLNSVGTGDFLLIADADLSAGDAPRKTTVLNLFEDALTLGTYVDINLTGNLTYGTATGNRTVSTNAVITNATLGTTTATAATITTGTIPTGTFGTTTSTAATITTGTIPTLTIGSTTATAGTVTTFNSTTGTITNLSTTLTGDLTISTGSATVGTRVSVVNTAQEYSRTHNFDATSLTITSGTIPWNLAENQVAKLEVTTNSTMNNPTNAVDGATYMLTVTQGTAGNNTLSFGTAYKFPGGTAPTLSVGSGDVDVIAFVSNGSVLYGVTSQDFS
jgi:hypothetical protein